MYQPRPAPPGPTTGPAAIWQPRTAPQGINPMQGAPGTAPGAGGLMAGLKNLFSNPATADRRKQLAESLMSNASALGGGGQQQMAPANFVVPAAEPGMLDPSPRGGTDPRMAALIRLLSQNA